MDDATTTMLRDTLRHNLSGDQPVDAMLADLGWDEVLAEDEAAATQLLFSEQGRALAASAALDAVVLRAIGLPDGPARVLYPTASPGPDPSTLDGLLFAPVQPGTRVLAVTGDALLELPATGEPLAALDPDAGWCRMRAAAEDARTLLTGDAARSAWERGRAAGRRALASELVGSGWAVLDAAVEHVRDRRQFGRAIGSFQSVRHRLADAYTGLLGAAALVEAAHADDTASSAAAAKAFAARAHAEALTHAMQVSGGMGLTWEHPLHRHARRGFALDALLGSADDVTAATGADLLAGVDPFPVGAA